MKVIRDFFCIQEKKAYKAGDEYTGKRKDLINYVQSESKEAIHSAGGNLPKGKRNKQS